MRNGTLSRSGIGAVVIAAALALCACTAPSAPASNTPAATAGAGLSPKAAAAKVMAGQKDHAVIASAKGTLESNGVASPVIAQVLDVRATATATVVTWRLKSASTSRGRVVSFQLARPPLTDTRLLGIVDTATDTTYRPYTYTPAKGNGEDLACACSTLPDYVDSIGEVLYAVMPPLPKSVAKVDVTLPGFDTMKAVAVDRAVD